MWTKMLGKVSQPSVARFLFGTISIPVFFLLQEYFFSNVYADTRGRIYLAIGFALIYLCMLLLISKKMKNLDWMLFMAAAMILAAAMALRISALDFISGDYTLYLGPWVDEMRMLPGFEALSREIGNYNVPYMYFLFLISRVRFSDLYLIKLVSIIFDGMLAYYGMKLIGLKYENKWIQVAGFVAIFLAPTVIMNSSFWAQCDSIWAAFVVASAYYFLKKRPVTGMVLWTLGFSFKIQAIFFLPLILLLVLLKQVKIRHLLVAIPTFFLTMVPAWLAGRSLWNIATIYLRQAEDYEVMSANAPTFPLFFWYNSQTMEDIKFDIYSSFSMFLAGTILLILLCYAYGARTKINQNEMIRLAFLTTAIIVFFLPRMHERYFYLADAFAIVYAFYFPKHWYVSIIFCMASMLTYGEYLFLKGNEIFHINQVVLILFVTMVIVVKDFYASTRPEIILHKTEG